VFPEWEKFGKIVQFKACNNLVPHLRGNVFIQYEKVEFAIEAYITMQNRFYAGYPLHIQFSLIKDWKQAICAYNGNQGMSCCPKYSECNFLHVYRNPRNEFALEKKSPDKDRPKDKRKFEVRKKFEDRKKFDDRKKFEDKKQFAPPPRDDKIEPRERSRSRDKKPRIDEGRPSFHADQRRRGSRGDDRDRRDHKHKSSHHSSDRRRKDKDKKKHKKRSSSRSRSSSSDSNSRSRSRSRNKEIKKDRNASNGNKKGSSGSRSSSKGKTR